MAITKLTTDLNNISALPDNPALTSREFKAKYDEAGNEIKAYINNVLTTEFDAAIDLKRNSSDVGVLLYNYSLHGSITDGATKTIPGISNYNILIADHGYGAIKLSMNFEKTKLFGTNRWYSFDDDSYWMMIKSIYGSVSGDTVTFSIKTTTHRSSQTHGDYNSSVIGGSIYGLM